MNKEYEVSKLERKYVDEKTHHGIHFILTVVTLGMWLCIWVGAASVTYYNKHTIETKLKELNTPPDNRTSIQKKIDAMMAKYPNMI